MARLVQRSRTTDANLDCAFVENTLAFIVLKIGWALGPPLTTPPLLAKISKIVAKTFGFDVGFGFSISDNVTGT